MTVMRGMMVVQGRRREMVSQDGAGRGEHAPATTVVADKT
jgi:hypothetical protein